MALNTRDKRAAVIGYKLPVARVYPNADGSLAAATDRQQITGEYPGIAASSPPVGGGATNMLRHHHYGL